MRVFTGATTLLAILGAAATLTGQGISRHEALAAVYPGATIHGDQLFLTEAQQKEVLRRAPGDMPSALVARYIATQNGQVIGRAYVDTHTVRTKKESLLISLDANGRLKRIDVTAFLEPAEYRAPDAWLQQYRDRPLDDDLAIDRAIRPIAGATLTARATNAAVRRVLAIDELLRGAGDER